MRKKMREGNFMCNDSMLDDTYLQSLHRISYVDTFVLVKHNLRFRWYKLLCL